MFKQVFVFIIFYDGDISLLTLCIITKDIKMVSYGHQIMYFQHVYPYKSKYIHNNIDAKSTKKIKLTYISKKSEDC